MTLTNHMKMELLSTDRYEISFNRLHLLVEMIIDANFVTGITLSPPSGFNDWTVSDYNSPRLTFLGLQFLLENA